MVRTPGTCWTEGLVDPRAGLGRMVRRNVPVPGGNETVVTNPQSVSLLSELSRFIVEF
jgi:hypothetical protein